MDRFIYLDNAATTKTAPEVLEAMLPYFTEYYGNPSSVYSFASRNKDEITKQREIIADVLGAKGNEIYFTAGGSEADNWALKATAEAYKEKGNHIRVLLKPGTDTETVYCQIENTGVFIPEEALVHLFEAFYRVEQSRNRQTGGSGLGLYIVKMILDQHGASYRMGNTCDGVCFSFSL